MVEFSIPTMYNYKIREWINHSYHDNHQNLSKGEDITENIRKSIFYNFSKFVKSKYGYEYNLPDAETELRAKITEHQDIRNKAAQKHLKFIILPAASLYQSLIINNLNENTVLKYIEEYVMHYYQAQAKFYRLVGKVPFFYGVLRKFLPSVMRSYPTQFWRIEWLKKDKQEIAFNMTDCLYYKTFLKYNCSQLTPVFCRVDNLCYDKMSKRVRFIRTKTLAGGNELCDFRFLKS